MLSTLIYRSRPSQLADAPFLAALADHARQRNEPVQVTGILLFDGDHFFQILEGPYAAVNAVYARICDDGRHQQIVELMRDYAPARRFGKLGMEVFDMRGCPPEEVLPQILARSTLQPRAGDEDRVVRFIRAFASGRWRQSLPGHDAEHALRLVTRPAPFQPGAAAPSQPCRFALQPIVDTTHQRVSALEALIRAPDGGSPAAYFASLSDEAQYAADLEAKVYAFQLAQQIGIGDSMISVNLQPMSLVKVPDAVPELVRAVTQSGLVPSQVIVEITESEFITHFDAFEAAIRQLRAAGFSLAMDDFGAGYAGLSLLARFQPDKIKIDRAIISGVHRSGARQAIVRAILACCSALEIAVVAEGVEEAEEWRWLAAAGIHTFQGYLFARPALEQVAPITWPLLGE
ncbi:diguanylate phosphodiesterase [Nissabacter sp. SGAir0207]|uniref:diguanylate phosphodiesterase n=1 Tax=Nissabacter sp. SGAir0207 TaxID=2126321 RepID=UPI0010CD09D9|nr:diguanylate phosphodiesterase [Nissabacter sp. SGAir0207]QCR38316.1 diguanylate phosphodiesterase [Nissabacter sp. SGAir0207]